MFADGRCHFVNLLYISGRRECVKLLISGEGGLKCGENYVRVVPVVGLYYVKISENCHVKKKKIYNDGLLAVAFMEYTS